MPTPDNHHHDVMISSTSLDLPDHREAAIKAVLRSNLYPRVMETLTATSADPITDSLALVDCAEIYVGIFAFRFRYGYVPKDPVRNPDKLSITEMEYRRALERGIPCLIYLAHKNHPIIIEDVETDPEKQKKLAALKEELMARHTCAFFKSAEELGSLLYQSLQEELAKGTIEPRPARAAADATPRTVPPMPQPYIVHPYGLTKKFFGRAEELKKLDAWGESADTGLIVESIGGVGKSALTWHWLESGRARKHIKDLAGVVWFSFYESNATMGNFQRHTLAYLTGKTPDDFLNMNFDDRERLLLGELKKRPVLLVLDGLERALIAYNRVDAPHLLDDQVESGTAKGAGIHAAQPLANGEAEDDETRQAERSAQLRSFTDPREGDFLGRLIDCAPSKVLISTRLTPSALQVDRHNPQLCDGVAHLHLNGLHPNDALALIRYLGVRGEADALKAFMAQFGNHSLLISVIAGRIARYHEQPGDFAAWHADEGFHLELADLLLEQKRSHILRYALDGLAPELRTLLGQIAAFRYPVDYRALSALNPYLPPKPPAVPKPASYRLQIYQDYLEDKTKQLAAAETEEEKAHWRGEIETYQGIIAEEQANQAAYEPYLQALRAYEQSPELREAKARFNAGLDELEDRGLLRWDRKANRYDLHPVVRAYSFGGLDAATRITTYGAIRSHFEGLPPENLDTVQDVSELRRTLEIYYALVNVGLLDEAARLYSERLTAVLQFHIAAYHLIVQLLTPLFPNGIDRLPSLEGPERQSAIVMDMANGFYYLGRTDEAMVLEGLNIGLHLDQRNAVGLGVSLRNYAGSLRSYDQLAAAGRAYLLARDLAEALGDRNGLAMSNLFLLGLYNDTGQWDQAEAAYCAFGAQPPTSQTAFWQADAEKYRVEMLIARGLDATEALDKAEALAVQGRNALILRQIARLRGEAALQVGDPNAAAVHFLRAVTLAEKQGSSDVAIYFGELVRARTAQGRHAEARRLLEENAVPSRSAAEVYFALGEHERARERALAAYKGAWAEGPPYSWWRNLERAKTVLAALGVEPPVLPPFDPGKVKPLPHEDEIRAWVEELRAEKAKRAEG